MQEDTQIVGQRMKLQADLVLRYPLVDNIVQLLACSPSSISCYAVQRWPLGFGVRVKPNLQQICVR